MKLLKRLPDEEVTKVNAIQTTDTSNLVKKVSLTQKVKILKRNFLTMKKVSPLIGVINFQI